MSDQEIIKYKNRVYDLLKSMKPWDYITISRICSAENNDLFIQCIEEYRRSLPRWGGIYFLNENKVIVKYYDV